MKKMLMVIITTISTFGCTEKVYITGPTITKTDTIVVSPSKQVVNLTVDWNKLNQSITSKLTDGMVYSISDSNLNITHIGTRLEYVKNNASFTQSVVNTGSNTSLITLDVPPTDTANMYVLAVHESNGVRKALKLGIKRNIRIVANSSINFTLDSLTLIDAEWTVTEPNVMIQKDTIFMDVNASSQSTVLNVSATDPYQVNTFVPYSNRIVKFYGSGYEYGNLTGWRKFGINVVNKSTSVTIDTFWPYVNGSLFNLNNDYVIGKQGIIKTTWQ